MNEIQNNKQKPKLCKLAIWSPLLVVFFWFFAIIFSYTGLPDIPVWFILSMFIILLLSSVVVGIFAIYRIHKSRGKLSGRFIAISGIILALFLIYWICCVTSVVPKRSPVQ